MRLGFFKRRRSSQQDSVLDLPFEQYDPKTRLPPSIRVGTSQVGPLVSLQQGKSLLHLHLLRLLIPERRRSSPLDHLTILAAFNQLRKEAHDFPRLVESAAFEYEEWAQTDVPRRKGTVGPLSMDELPPLRVLMCWHAHMLNPKRYDRDCESAYMFLKPLGHFPIREAAQAIRSGSLPDELAYGSDGLRPTLSITGWAPPDVAAAVLRQAKFVGDMHRIGWLEIDAFKEDPRPLQRGIVRYHAWLDLMAATSCQHFLVPTLDIDLAWHTHQLLGQRYRADTERLLGEFLDHNDSAGDGKIGDGFKKTAVLWKDRFGYEY